MLEKLKTGTINFTKALLSAAIGLLFTAFVCEMVVRVNAKYLMPPWYFLRGHEETRTEQGFRGETIYDEEAPEGVLRIMGVGDSFTFGQFVKEEETFLSQLENKINEQGEVKCEVLNAGVPGFNTVDELKRFYEKGMKFGPDVLVLGITFDDVNLGNFNPPVIFPEIEKHLKNSYFYSLLRYRYRTLLQKLCGRSFDATDLYFFSYSWLSFSKAMDMFKNLADKEGIRVVAVILPYAKLMSEKPYPYQFFTETVEQKCNNIGIPVLDLAPAYYEYMEKEQMSPAIFFASLDPPDDHPSPTAHNLIAGKIYEFLQKKEILKKKGKVVEQTQPAG